MDHSVTFARHFCRLIWLLLKETGNIDEQKATLRAVVTVSKDGAVILALKDGQLMVNDAPVPEAFAGVPELVERLRAHAVTDLMVDCEAAPADLLGAARILAAEPDAGPTGANALDRLQALGARTVRVALGADSPVDAKPVALMQEDSGTYLAFAAVQATAQSIPTLLAKVDATPSLSAMTRLLDEIVTLAEDAARDGRAEAVADAWHGVVAREAATEDAERKRAFGMAIRRLVTPTLLRTVATLLPRRPERLEEILLVLTRAGEDGADALIEQLAVAQSLGDRRLYLDALVRLNAGVPALIHMLGDALWHVARNAADLLGEMRATEADGALAEQLSNPDDRVRRAAAAALAKLGTPKALQALSGALADVSPQVRMQAIAGLGTHKTGRAASALVKALDEETDADLQTAILQSLGKVGTPEAVQRLMKAAEPDGRLFKKKPIAHRVAAVLALGEVKSPAALGALRELLNDKDKEVREAVFRVVMEAQKNSASA